MQCFKAELHEKSGLDEGQMKGLECGIRWVVEAPLAAMTIVGLLHSGHITACYSRHDSDIHIIHRRLELESDHVKIVRIIHCAQRTCTRFAWFPILAETLPNNADWFCFKTPILQEILRTQNLHQVEHCVFLEVIRLFVQQNQKSFLWMQD